MVAQDCVQGARNTNFQVMKFLLIWIWYFIYKRSLKKLVTWDSRSKLYHVLGRNFQEKKLRVKIHKRISDPGNFAYELNLGTFRLTFIFSYM